MTVIAIPKTERTGVEMCRAYTASLLAPGQIDVKKRVIRGYSVITRGEALSHGMWVDEVCLDQIVTAGNQAVRGVKVRFAHPGLCDDGLGKFLGRAKGFRRDGNQVRADLHFAKAPAGSPKFTNDPVTYIMDLASEDPEAFATSIVYYHDVGAEDRFIAEHEDEDGHFESPDADNTNNFYHMRLAKLVASDLVDQPAANPGGFFSAGQEQAGIAEVALEYTLGLSDQEPPPGTFGTLEPARVRRFIAAFLGRHKLEIKPINVGDAQMDDQQVDEQTQETEEELVPEGEAVTIAEVDDEQVSAEGESEDVRTVLKELREAFPDDPEFAAGAFLDNLSVVEARARYMGVLQERLKAKDQELGQAAARETALRAENEDIKSRLLGGAEPQDFAPEPQNAPFMQLVDVHQKEHKCSGEEAVKACIELYPEAYKAHLAN